LKNVYNCLSFLGYRLRLSLLRRFFHRFYDCELLPQNPFKQLLVQPELPEKPFKHVPYELHVLVQPPDLNPELPEIFGM
jgi:hypothetical protein